MEQKELISVIVPIYNVEKYLRQCVDSILGQTYPNLEIILVDDGSPDGCGGICDAYAAKDVRIRVIHKENGGLSHARNAGIDMARGDYLAFVDSDDYLEPDAYETMLDAARRYGAKLVCAGRYDEDEQGGQRCLGLCPEREEFLSAETIIRKIFHWEHLDSASWDKLYARELFRDIRYPVGRVVEDVPTTYRLVLLAEGGVLLPKPIYHYRHRAGSITSASITPKTFHFSQHAIQVYQDIRTHYPALEPDARYLLVYALRYDVQVLDTASRADRQRYRQQYRRSRRQLAGQLGFILSSDAYPRREKNITALTALGLFRPALGLYHRIKKVTGKP